MKLTKIKLCNYRCFGSEEQIIPVDDITALIGNNSSGRSPHRHPDHLRRSLRHTTFPE